MRKLPLRGSLSLVTAGVAVALAVQGAVHPVDPGVAAMGGMGMSGGMGVHGAMGTRVPRNPMSPLEMRKHLVTNAMRQRAANDAAKEGLRIGEVTKRRATAAAVKPAAAAAAAPAAPAAVVNPAAPPDYFGGVPNYANSPLPTVAANGTVTPGTGIRKFIDSLPGLGSAQANDLGQFLPVAVPDTVTFPGSDYYEIHLVQYAMQLHKDLPATTLRGYVQANNGTDATGKNTVVPAAVQFLGPLIVAQKDRPVRVKFVNTLPVGAGGNLQLPVDTTLMGAGTGPNGGTELYSQNRGTLHLHGGFTPWISDGTPHQWTAPAGETTSYPKGVSTRYVPDMWFDAAGNVVPAGTTGASNNPGPGAMTFYYTNQQSARLLFYHDHALGLTRLNVYAGEAAGYLLRDAVEQNLISTGVLPSSELPLIIQDRTFVPDTAQLAAEDPTWNPTAWGGKGSLWFPHVYMPNQHPSNATGINPMGRWDYGPWFWPPFTGIAHGAVTNPYAGPNAPWEPATQPGTPTPSVVPEAFMDTPVVNGTAYPFLPVERKAYRFRILNASNDRTLNLQLYYAKSGSQMWNADGTLADGNAGEVPMVPAVTTPGFPAGWPTDGRAGGVPDPAARGPQLIQIGTEGGLLPAPAVLSSQPVDYDYNRRSITFGNVTSHTLLLGPAERADVIVDFSQVPAGSKLILYNDAPAPIPALDTRYDYYTGDPDQTSTGGAPSTVPGYGPNTRTVMQFQVGTAPAAAAFDLAGLTAKLPTAYRAAQPAPIVPEVAYNASQGTTAPNTYGHIQDNQLKFVPQGGTATVTLPLQPKAIVESFDPSYGRMNATLGVEIPNTTAATQTTIPFGYAEPTTEELRPSDLGTPVGSLNDGTQLWKITHNGVDTHAIHFHLFDVQLVNRVGWDNSLRPPDANEVGWKDTVRMNPLEDVIVAIRPSAMKLPFKLGNSIRPIDPTMPTTATISTFDPLTGGALTVTNEPRNYGWEYVWHCHLLGHEENDMMRPLRFSAAPSAPTGLTAAVATAPATGVVLAWTDTSTAPTKATNVVVQRATSPDFGTNLVTSDLTPLGAVTSWTDTTTAAATTYYYRVRSETAVGYSEWSGTATVATP